MTQPAGVTSGMSMVSTAPGHMAGKSTLTPTGGTSDDYGNLQYRVPTQPALDGNTVDIDTERVQFADNTLHFEVGHDGAIRPDQIDAVGDPVGLVRSHGDRLSSTQEQSLRD